MNWSHASREPLERYCREVTQAFCMRAIAAVLLAILAITVLLALR